MRPWQGSEGNNFGLHSTLAPELDRRLRHVFLPWVQFPGRNSPPPSPRRIICSLIHSIVKVIYNEMLTEFAAKLGGRGQEGKPGAS